MLRLRFSDLAALDSFDLLFGNLWWDDDRRLCWLHDDRLVRQRHRSLINQIGLLAIRHCGPTRSKWDGTHRPLHMWAFYMPHIRTCVPRPADGEHS